MLLIPDLDGPGIFHLVIFDTVKTMPGLIFLVLIFVSIWIFSLIVKSQAEAAKAVALAFKNYFSSPKRVIKKMLILIIFFGISIYFAILASDLLVSHLPYEICSPGVQVIDVNCKNR